MTNPDTLLPRTVQALERGRQTGLHFGAQLFVSRSGETLADLALGEAQPGIPMHPDTRTLWMSSGKPLTAAALAQLHEQGRLEWDDPAIRFVPEFGQGGKEPITLRHLLAHTAGFRDADRIPEGLSWEETIARICATPLEAGWTPGQSAGYQLFASWFILGEIIQRVTGTAFDEYLRATLLRPLGMNDSGFSLTPDQFRGEPDRFGFMWLTGRSGTQLHPTWNTESAAAACRPGSSARGPIRELGRFYETLLATTNNAAPSSILKPSTVQTLTTRQRVGLFDQTFRHILDWGLGFLIDSNQYGVATAPYGYGRHASQATFGHSGSQSSCAFADPAHQLVVAWHCNGQPGEPRHQQRAREINEAIYLDLNLASGD